MTKRNPCVWASQNPRIALFTNFLSDEECNYLIELSEPRMTRSTVVVDNDEPDAVHDGRTSSGCCLERGETWRITAIEKRLAQLTGTPLENGEGLQILRYEEGQHYLPHHDYFDPGVGGYMKYLERGGQRTHTCIMYLSDEFAQGETEFPLLRCVIPPRKGSVLVFCNITPEGRLDEQTLHGGRPPTGGVKWIATKWIRQRVF